MPYIAINTAVELSSAQKEKIKCELGRLIELIPTKSEANLLVDFSGGRTMYHAGKEIQGAFIELRLYTRADFEPKKKFTEAVFKLLSDEFGFKSDAMFLNILEFENWGARGSLL